MLPTSCLLCEPFSTVPLAPTNSSNPSARLHLSTKQLLQHHLPLGNFWSFPGWFNNSCNDVYLRCLVFSLQASQTVRGRLKPGLCGSLQDYQVAAGFAECPLRSCLSWSDHSPSMISSLLFQSSSSAPTDLLLLPLPPHYISTTCSISLFPWTSR